MDLSNYKSGNYKSQHQYKSFLPSLINTEWRISDAELTRLLSEADFKLGELNAFSQLVPDVDFFIKMHISKEAALSSRIEGTRTGIEDALQKIENIDPEKRDDWQEVQNYILAMNSAIESLKTLPISNRLLKNTHQILLQGVRGRNKQPGEFRKSQNWIGGITLKDAAFVPPHPEDLADLMSHLEKFLNDQAHPLPHLVRIGMAHVQFETIHPFLDGNGRIGRLLVTLYLVANGLLSRPVLYLSAFFEKNRSLYYDNLDRVRTHHDMARWLKFFLEGVGQTAQNSIETFRAIIRLREEVEYPAVAALGKKSSLARQFMQMLYGKPVVDSQEIASYLSVNPSTAWRLMEDFIRLGILDEITGQKRNRIFVYKKYLQLFE
jgi:Fic family protein